MTYYGPYAIKPNQTKLNNHYLKPLIFIFTQLNYFK